MARFIIRLKDGWWFLGLREILVITTLTLTG
jgi:hypothetical protein